MLVSICDVQKQTCDDATDVARDLAALACSADVNVDVDIGVDVDVPECGWDSKPWASLSLSARLH